MTPKIAFYKYSQGQLCLSYYHLILYMSLTTIKRLSENMIKCVGDNTNWTLIYILLVWKWTLVLFNFLQLTFINMSSKPIFLKRLLWIVEYVLGYTVFAAFLHINNYIFTHSLTKYLWGTYDIADIKIGAIYLRGEGCQTDILPWTI